MPNFSFIQSKPEYSLFALTYIETEKFYTSASAICAAGCRKALELAVKMYFN